LAGMEELGMLAQVATPAQVFVPYFVESQLSEYLRLAAVIRQAGFGVEVYPEAKKLGQQLKYADRKGFHIALIVGEDELAQNVCQLKDLFSGESKSVPVRFDAPLIDAQELIAALRERLAGGKSEE